MIAPYLTQKITRSFVVITTLFFSFLILLSSCTFKTSKSEDYSGTDGRSGVSSCSSYLICEPGLLIVKESLSATSAVTAINDALALAKSGASFCSNGCVIDARAHDAIALTNRSDTASSSGFEKITSLDSHVWLVGAGETRTKIDAHQEQPFHVNEASSHFFALQQLSIEDGKVKGGDAIGGAGAGMGAGGALYINNGTVVADHVSFKGNNATGGSSSGEAGKGGDGGGNEGSPGADGARMNGSARHNDNAAGGKAGKGGDRCGENNGPCDPDPESHAGEGSLGAGFGAGGGSAGGGGSDWADGSENDRARDGGFGGNGGFGGGGGGGGGGGADDKEGDKSEYGDGGYGGTGGAFANSADRGWDGERGYGGTQEDIGGDGGRGGSGAGLGGAVFVRQANGAAFNFYNGTTSNNSISTKNVSACGVTTPSDGYNAFFILESTDSCRVVLKANGTSDYNDAGKPEIALSIVGLNGQPRKKFFEGQRAFLKVSLSSSANLSGKKLYLYLSDNDAFAVHGTTNVDADVNADFGWNGSRLIALDFPNTTKSTYFADINNKRLVATQQPLPYLGIPLYLDEELEGSETFDISLLTSPYYQLDSTAGDMDYSLAFNLDNDEKTTVRVQIEDANYRVALDTTEAKTAFCDSADALEEANSTASDCSATSVADEINVEALKGLGFVTVKALRPTNVFRRSKIGHLTDSTWINNPLKSSPLILGSLFNNALTGGLPVHYRITGDTDGVLSNQINYNNEHYDGKTDPALSQPNAQISRGVVIPAIDVDINSLDPDDPPDIDSIGEAKIYFSALPDAIKTSTKTFKVTLEAFEDPSYSKSNFCTNEAVDLCTNLYNTPEGNYQFYVVATASSDHAVDMTIHDAGEFSPSILMIDNINGELITDAADSANPLLTDADGNATVWVRLGSQPTSNVTVAMDGEALTFTTEDWYLFQQVTVNASGTLSVASSSSDTQYGSSVNRTLAAVAAPEHFKIKEGQQTEVSSRHVFVGVQTNMKRFNEGQMGEPSYTILLGQPLPFATEVTLNIALTEFAQEITTTTTQRTITVPAWHQHVDFTVPFADNDTSDPIRHLIATVEQVSDLGGAVLTNIIPAQQLLKASIIVFDDEAANIELTQHLPATPTPNDVARLMPKVKILGVNPDGSLQVQHDDNRITGISIQPVCDDGASCDTDINTKTFGLFMEFIDNTPISTEEAVEEVSRATAPFDYIQPSRRAFKGRVNASAAPLTVENHPQAQITRQSGYLTVETSGFYTFSATNSSPNADYELWLNTQDDYSQHKQLILPYFIDENLDQIPDGSVDDVSAPIELQAGKRYYIETLYAAGQTDATGDLSIHYQMTETQGGTLSALAEIPLHWLEPNAIGAGFYVDTYEGITERELDAFVASDNYQQDNATRKEFYTNTLSLNQLDAAEKVGRKVKATIIAPETGDYQFAIASDGDSMLWFAPEGETKQLIATVDGNERAGVVALARQTGSYVGHTYPKYQLSVTRDKVSNNNWSIGYVMDPASLGTAPYGAASKLSVYPDFTTEQAIHVSCSGFVSSSQVLRTDPADFEGALDTQAPLYSNTITVETGSGCLNATDLGDGTETVNFTVWEYGGLTSSDDYTFTHINGNPIEFPDYPQINDWYWSLDDSGETAGPSHSQQQSDKVHLTKGEAYTIELAQINVKQEDHFSVAWKLPSSESFEVMDTAHIAFTERTLPVSIVEATGALPTINASGEVSLTLVANTFTYANQDFAVTSITLAGEPVVAVGEALPYAAPGWLEFASGFAATVKDEATITTAATPAVLTPQDRPSDSSTVNLTVGQQQRIGIQLASKPLSNVTIHLDDVAIAASGQAAQVALYCDAGSGSTCETYTFTPDNWAQAQYVTVVAMQEGTNSAGDYQPDISVVEIQVTQEGAGDYSTDIVEVHVFPDSSETDTTYFAMANGNEIEKIVLSDPASISVTQDQDGDPVSLAWNWEANETGTQLIAWDVSAEEPLLTVRAMSSDQEANLTGGTLLGSEPIDLNVQLLIGPSFYKASDLHNASLSISNLALELGVAGNTPTTAAYVDISIDNGRPFVALRSIQTGVLHTQSALTAFAYTPSTDAGAQPITASVAETIITEYGELSVINDQGEWQWRFASNPRPQADSIVFTVSDGTEATETATIASFQQGAYLATSLSALPDLTKPRVVLTAKNGVTEVSEGNVVTFVATLMDATGANEVQATEDMNIFYKVAQLGVTDPGNSALIIDDGTHAARGLAFDSALMLFSETRKAFTVEAWLQPTVITGEQPIFGGKVDAGENSDASILKIANQQLVTGSGLTLPLPEDIDLSNGFHVTWRVSEFSEAVFVNGQKRAEVDLSQNMAAIESMHVLTVGNFGSQYFNGSLDEVRVWDIARSDAQIAQIYNAALADVNDDTSSLSGYWSFNRSDLANEGSKALAVSLIDETGETLDLNDAATKAMAWYVRQPATNDTDYTGLEAAQVVQEELLALDASQTQGRTTFALADLNQDKLLDVILANHAGDISLHVSQPADIAKDATLAARFRTIHTNINLGHAAPLLLTQLDGEHVLLAGLPHGKLGVVRHVLSSIRQQLTAKASAAQVSLNELQTLSVQHPLLTSRLQAHNDKLRAVKGAKLLRENALLFAPATWGEHIVLASKVGLLPFTLQNRDGRIQLAQATASGLSAVTYTTPLFNRNVFPHFIDIDKDGDQDLLVDTLYNLPGQTAGVMSYYQNYGSDTQPLFMPAPRSRVADMLSYFDRYLAPNMRKRGQKSHPFDQVAYRQIMDIDADGNAEMVTSDNYGKVNVVELPNYFAVLKANTSSVDIPVQILADGESEVAEEITLQLVEGTPEQAHYHFVKGQDRVTAVINDTTQAGIALLNASGSVIDAGTTIEVDEQDRYGSYYTVKLLSKPTEDVTVRVGSSDVQLGARVAPGDTQSSISNKYGQQAVLTFSAGSTDWTTGKQVWIAGTGDEVDDPDHEFAIVAVSASADPNYAQQTLMRKAKSVNNNDDAALNFSYATLPVLDSTGAIVSGEGQVNAVTVSLNAQPTAPLSVTLQPSDSELTLFPQRKLIRALTVNTQQHHVSQTFSRLSTPDTCTLPSGNSGIPALGRFGAWCWAENGEYRYEQARFDEGSQNIEQLSFVVDNSYGKLSTDTLSVRLQSAPEVALSEHVLIYDLNTEQVLGDSHEELLLANRRVGALAQGADYAEQIKTVSFAVRPATAPDQPIEMTVTGLGSVAPLVFTADNWTTWQRVDVEGITSGTVVTVDAGSYAESQTLSVVEQASPRLILQDWRSSQQIVDSTGKNTVYSVERANAEPVVLRARLSSAPSAETTVAVSGGNQVTFNAENFSQWQSLASDADGGATVTVSATGGGYSDSRTLDVVPIKLVSRQGNFFDHAGNLAGEKLTLAFTPDNWKLGQTIAVAAVDDMKVEYNTQSFIAVSYADESEVINGQLGRITWDDDGLITLAPKAMTDAGTYVEKRLWFTDDDSNFTNHSLDIVITTTVNGDTISAVVEAFIDQPNCVRVDDTCRAEATAQSFTLVDNSYQLALPLPSNNKLTGVALAPLAAEYLADRQPPIAVSIQDNDLPVVRAGVDLHAGENTHPGYFTLSVRQPVGIPGGLGVHYQIHGYVEGENYGATAETIPPADNELADPGPDFQAYDTLQRGTAFIPEGKTRVSLPIFPIDDFTPEESLAARYEKVVLVLSTPNEQAGYAGDAYRLDQRNTEYQRAGVKILDNEDVGLKFVLPLDGVLISEGSFGAFKVGLKSQPQTEVAIDFYNTIVRQNNQFDGTYLQADRVTFDNTDWNQWKMVNVVAFDNQKENLDKRAPRYSDLFYTVLDKSHGGAGNLNCMNDPLDPTECEPFYNTMKGALNQTASTGDKASETVELKEVVFTSSNDLAASSAYGSIAATPLKGGDVYAGDFVYRLHTGDYGTSDKTEAILQAIAEADGNVLVDVFDYEMTSLLDESITQKVAVYINALERTTLETLSNTDEFTISGKYGTLAVTKSGDDYQYTYSFDESSVETALGIASGDSYKMTDPFVYRLESTDGTSTLTEHLSVNVVIRKYTAETDGTTRYSAQVNGNSPELCDATNILCTNGDQYITGRLTSDSIGGNTGAGSLTYTITAAGRPSVLPVVTKMTIRDSSDREIWVANNVLSTNPLFDTNAVNGADRLLDVGEDLRGKYGQFSVTANGAMTYVVDVNSFASALEETDLRVASEEFVLALSNNRELPVTITSVVQHFQGEPRLFVSANGQPLQRAAGTTSEFTGRLLDDELALSVLRAGRLTHTVQVRDAALDPVAIADGLRESLMFVQQRFYDTSVPVFGRFGGGPTTDTSGRSADANTPAFIDRFMSVVESQILSQPHLTTEELTSLINVALQSIFSQYNVPLQVLKVDTEKMLLKFSYSAGVSSATDEYKTDWGMAGMGHFSGSTAGTFKYTVDLVFGVKFRTIVSGEEGSDVLRHSIFIVTDKNTLSALMGEPQVDPVTLYDLKTWEGINVGQTGVQFVNAQGKRLDERSAAIRASNTSAINTALKNDVDPIYGMQPQIDWRWKEEQSDMHWGTANEAKGTVKDFGTIIGYITNNTGSVEYAEFIAISLRQPESIGPNKVTPIQMSVVLDPHNILSANRSSDNLAKEAIGTVLHYLKDNGGLTFDKQRLKVFDIYAEQQDPKQDQKSLHESQQLDVTWNVSIEEEVSTDPIGIHLPTYSAKLTVSNVSVDTDIAADITVLPVDSMVADIQTVSTPCATSSNSGYQCKTEKLQIKTVWKGETETKRFFPTDKNAFKTKTTYSEIVQMEHGKLKLKGKVVSNKVQWTWEYSSLPAKSLNFGNENIIEVPKMTFQAEGTSCGGAGVCVVSEYVITKHMLMFLNGQPEDDTTKMQAVSKVTVDMAGSMEFRGDMQLWVVGASVNQATRSPSNVEEGALIHPEEIFDNLVGSADAKQTIVAIDDPQDTQGQAPYAYIVGQYGVLAVLPSGQYAYALKPELSMSTWNLSCDNLDAPLANAVDAALRAQCDLLLSTDEAGNLLFWPDRTSTPAEAIYAKGYTFTCPSYNDLIAGNGECSVTSPIVLFTPEDRDQLTKDGVPSLESTLGAMELTSWQDTANLSNKKTLNDLYLQMQTGQTPDALNGVTELVDEFFISVASDTAFRPLTITLGAGGSMEASFNEIATGGLASEEVSYDATQAITVNAWAGANLNYHEPGIGQPLQMSSKPINPMAEANVFVDVALKVPGQTFEDDVTGILYPMDLLSKPREIVQYTIGGNAAMYAHINGGIFAPPSENGDDEEYQGFSLPGPSVGANIGLAAQFTGTADFSDVSNRGAEFMFGAYNLELDLGEFISDKLVEPLGHLNNALEPIQPIANALTADMKIFSAINLERVFDANEDGKVTILEVPTPFLESGGPKAQKYEQQLMAVNRFLEFIASISDMIRIADELGNELAAVQSLQEQIISTDGYQISPDVIRIVPSQSQSDLTGVSSQLVPYVNQLGHVVLGTDTNYQYIKTLGGNVGPSTVREMKPVQPAPAQNSTSKNKSMNKVKSRYNDLQKRGLIDFPILSNPADVLKFVFGDPADLIILDVPDFIFDFEVQKGWRPPPVPIFLGKISGGFEMGTDTVLGVDTGGLLQTICGSDEPSAMWNCQGELSGGDRAIRLLNSVFVRDWSEQSYYAGGDTGADKVFWQGNQRELPGYTVWDKHELAGNAEIDIGAGIDIGVFGAMFQGGPGLGGGIDLVDLCESTTPDECETINNGEFTAGGYYDGKIRAYDFAMQMIDDSMSSFDMAFTFYVDFEAYIHTFHIKVWEELIGYFPLFVFDLDGAHWVGGAKSLSGAPLAGATLYFDANNNQQYDVGEPMTFTDAKGRGSIHIPFELFDRNLDGRIDTSDGTIRHFGGVNIHTGLGELEQVNVH